MLEFSFRFTLADDTSTDEALIAGLPHDLRAIADQIAERWPGNALDASLDAGGRLARPARLEVDLAHGGHATIEVRKTPVTTAGRLSTGTATDSPRENRRWADSSRSADHDLEDALAAIVSPERLEALTRDVHFVTAFERAAQVLASATPERTRSAVRLVRSFAGPFVDLVAKDRSGTWVRVPGAPTVDPYYLCAEFQGAGTRHRVPLPHLLPTAAESRRSSSIPLDIELVVTLLEHVLPTELEAVRAAGRDYLARRRDWASRGRYSK